MKSILIAITALSAGLALAGGWFVMPSFANAEPNGGKTVVGVWFVTFPDAPFKYHMCTFHADGTMEQANPDAGDAHTSDSDGMGVWVREGSKIRGKFVEVTADRTTRQFASRGEISFTLDVAND